MPENNKKPASTIGFKNFVLAPITKDDDTGTEYGDIIKVAGAIEASITQNNADPDIQYADDVEFDAVNPDPDITFALKMVDLPLEVRSKLSGSTIDQNGVLISNAADKSAYYAAGFMSEKADGTFRYVWLYKCRVKPMTENYASKEGTTITRQTGDVEFGAIKRVSDGNWKATADEGQNGFTKEKAANFLATVYEPSMSAA